MTEAERAKLEGLLADPYYERFKLLERFRSGDLKFEIGASDWPKEWYSDPYWNRSVPIALAVACQGGNNFRLTYYRPLDFFHVRFDLGGEEYVVQWYKVVTLHRRSDLAQVDFGRHDHNVGYFFEFKKHLKPESWHAGYYKDKELFEDEVPA